MFLTRMQQLKQKYNGKTSKRLKIITHAGQSHFDEVCAIALILGWFDGILFEILRREPTKQELLDPEIFCVDIGMEHNPDLSNFDHHQNSLSHAAFVLVAQAFEIDEDLKSLFEWYAFKDLLDTRGPFIACEEYHINNLEPFVSSIEGVFLEEFRNNPASMLSFLTRWGKSMIAMIAVYKERMAYYKLCPVHSFEIDGVEYKVLFTYTDNIQWLNKYVQKYPVQLAVSFDEPSRGAGLAIYRYDSVSNVFDFSVLYNSTYKDHRVAFAHTNGFIMKTYHRHDSNEVMSLIKETYERTKNKSA